MILSTGVDIIEISRVEETLGRRGERFLTKVFTQEEIAYCEGKASRSASYAVRFAAKEAVMKALGTGWAKGIGFKDIEVVSNDGGAPSVRLHGAAERRFREVGGRSIHVSLSHSRDFAIAQAIIEC